MKRIILSALLCWVTAPSYSFASGEADPHTSTPDLPPCITACLKKDTELHAEAFSPENVKKTIQEVRDYCLANDHDLHTQTLRIFMKYGRSKEYIIAKLKSFMDQNSLATIECLFGAFVKKINDDSEATRRCLTECTDADFKSPANKAEL